MKILVMSDSHGDYAKMRRVVMAHSEAEMIIHCGDGEQQSDKLRWDFPDKAVCAVRGNCDWGSSLPLEEIITVENKKIMYTHGHIYRVKYGYDEIKQAAREKGADIVLFGHTHIPFCEYDDGLYVMNPGSIGGYGATYGVIEITPQGVITNIVEV